MNTILFNPFERYPEKKLLLIGIICTSLSIYLASILDAHFDGAIDVHLVNEIVHIKSPLIESIISIGCLVLFIFIAGKIYNSKTRIIDIFVTVLIARIPLYLILPFNINHYYSELALSLAVDPNNLQNLPQETLLKTLVFSLVIFALVIWFFMLLWNGYKTATHAKGAKSIVLFILAIIIAEIASKALLSLAF